MKKNLFYYYHNWKAGQLNKIHKGHCNHCRFGLGKQVNADRGANGVWIGPFSTIRSVYTYINKYLPTAKTVAECDHCCKTN